jgi:hypothetical protein
MGIEWKGVLGGACTTAAARRLKPGTLAGCLRISYLATVADGSDTGKSATRVWRGEPDVDDDGVGGQPGGSRTKETTTRGKEWKFVDEKRPGYLCTCAKFLLCAGRIRGERKQA